MAPVQYVESDLRQELSLTTAARPKFSCSSTNLSSLLVAVYDPRLKAYDLRERLHLHLSILTILYAACRPSEVLLSPIYADENDTFKWKDVELVVIAKDGDQRPTYGVRVKFRHLKGSHDDESVFKRKAFFAEQDAKFDVVALFYMLADVDKVLPDSYTLSQLLGLSAATVAKQFKGELLVQARPDALDRPILRAHKLDDDAQGYVLSNSASLKYNRGAFLLNQLGTLAGFKGK